MPDEYSCYEIDEWEKIGEGSFGMVFKGELQSGKKVAIKIMKGNTDGASWAEINRMKPLNHPNVLKLLGTVPTDDGHGDDDYDDYCYCSGHFRDRTWLVLEYMPLGSLRTFVSYTKKGGLSGSTMDKMAYQIAFGMDYLHRIARIVHRDLAARNILVADNMDVKIADFGLCNDYFEDEYYFGTHGKPCPVRWMPPENLPDAPPYTSYGRFSRKGDVWSFGVVLYEIWTRGKLPLGDLQDEDIIWQVKNCETTVLTPGVGFQVHARSWVMGLMKMCLEFDKKHRPNFRQIYSYIDENSEYQLH